MENDVPIVLGAYAAFDRGDIPALLDAYHPDVEFVIPDGWVPIAGIHRGWDNVLAEVIEIIPQRWSHLTVRPERVLSDADCVVVLGRYQGRGRRSGLALDVAFVHVWWMRGGRARRIEVFSDTAEIARIADAEPPDGAVSAGAADPR